jgi:hypothetical protein
VIRVSIVFAMQIAQRGLAPDKPKTIQFKTQRHREHGEDFWLHFFVATVPLCFIKAARRAKKLKRG